MRIKFEGNPEEVKQAEKCLEILLGEYTPEQQYAASILLHMMLKNNYGTFVEIFKEITGFKVNNRQSGKAITWAKKIKQRGKCEICGTTENLVAHHIIPWAYSIAGRFDLDNGQCLCEECHKMMHDDDIWIEYIRNKYERKE